MTQGARNYKGCRSRNIRFCTLVFALCLLVSGCAQTQPAPAVGLPPGPCLISGVPFFAQEPFHCGPASMAGVLGYFGQNIAPEQIASELNLKPGTGTPTVELAPYFRDRGFDARMMEGSPQLLGLACQQKIPLVLMLDLGIGRVKRPHFAVFIGMDENGVILNSGADKALLVPWRRFLSQWERAGNFTLWAKPKSYDGSQGEKP
ncbi:MAG: cysteine peptidase family C39 domain-containing protein [Desulfatibacillaceae bacterium]|nr:cysteine peptidase family C39 domain-containing protein [Desulfatibacillaceae bacterium]